MTEQSLLKFSIAVTVLLAAFGIGGSRMLSAEIIMQQLLSSLTAASPLSDVPDFRYSCSAGIAFANPGESASDVLRRADTALYEAKNTGRNRFVIYGAAS